MIQTELGHKRREKEGEGEGREVRGGNQGATRPRKYIGKMAGLCKRERLGEEKQKPSL